jgi:hypothetical protein
VTGNQGRYEFEISQIGLSFMVRYPFDVLRAVSQVEPLTTNEKPTTYRALFPFALRYRRVNGDLILVIGQTQFWNSISATRYIFSAIILRSNPSLRTRIS